VEVLYLARTPIQSINQYTPAHLPITLKATRVSIIWKSGLRSLEVQQLHHFLIKRILDWNGLVPYKLYTTADRVQFELR